MDTRSNREDLDKIEQDEWIFGIGFGRIMPDGRIEHIPALEVLQSTQSLKCPWGERQFFRLRPDQALEPIPAEQIVTYRRIENGDSVTEERTYPGLDGLRHVLRIGHHTPCKGGPSCKCLPLRSSDIHFPKKDPDGSQG